VPTLQTLRDEHGDSSSMAVLTGRDILYLVHVSTKRRIRLGANVGTRFAAHATSLGRAILAFQPEEDIEAFLAGAPFQKFTDFTITGAGELREELAETRRSGFASAKDELDFGIVSIAVPIFDENRRAIAAINCSTSTTRVSREDLISTRLPGLQEAAREIERALKRWPALVHSLHPT